MYFYIPIHYHDDGMIGSCYDIDASQDNDCVYHSDYGVIKNCIIRGEIEWE